MLINKITQARRTINLNPIGQKINGSQLGQMFQNTDFARSIEDSLNVIEDVVSPNTILAILESIPILFIATPLDYLSRKSMICVNPIAYNKIKLKENVHYLERMGMLSIPTGV